MSKSLVPQILPTTSPAMPAYAPTSSTTLPQLPVTLNTAAMTLPSSTLNNRNSVGNNSFQTAALSRLPAQTKLCATPNGVVFQLKEGLILCYFLVENVAL